MRNNLIKVVFILTLLLLTRTAYAEDTKISIYDSPTDKTKVVVEICESKCAKLITDKKTLGADYDKIEVWAISVTEMIK